MEMIHTNMHLSLNKVILTCVLLNCFVAGLPLALILILSRFNFHNSGIMGFFEPGAIVVLPITGMIAGFKIGDFYIFIYNAFAGPLNIPKIELNDRL